MTHPKLRTGTSAAPVSEAGALRRSLSFVREFVRCSRRRRLVAAIFLIPLGFLIEGASILMLIPILALVLETRTGSGSLSTMAQSLLNLAGATTPGQKLLLLLCLFGLLMITRAMVLMARDIILAHLQVSFIERLRINTLRDVAEAPWHRLARIRHGRVMALLSNDLQACGAAAHQIIQCSVSAIMIVGYVALIIFVSPSLGVVSLLLLAAIGAGLIPLIRHALATGSAMSRAHYAMADALLQFLGGLKLAKSFGGVERFMNKLQEDQETLSTAQASYMIRQSRARILLTSTFALAAAALIYVGFALFSLGTPQLIAQLLLLSRLGGPALQFQQGLHTLVSSVPAFERIVALRAELRHGDALVANVPINFLAQAPLKLNRVTFAYDESRQDEPGQVIDVSLEIAPGSIIGLSGPSGAGKSTLADLMAGMILPTNGSISIGGATLQPETLRAWRQKVSYVPQDAFLLNDDVAPT